MAQFNDVIWETCTFIHLSHSGIANVDLSVSNSGIMIEDQNTPIATKQHGTNSDIYGGESRGCFPPPPPPPPHRSAQVLF